MRRNLILALALNISLFQFCCLAKTSTPVLNNKLDTQVMPGAHAMDEYLPKLQGKRVGVVVNHTSIVGERHLVDTLLARGINITVIFAPEHGFKGTADAGEIIENSRYRSVIPIKSLYGQAKKPAAEDMKMLDIILFDIQDVGVRFFTYLSTMHYVMEAAAENGKKVLVLDRPNPNIHRIDGPVMEDANKSFVGLHTVPILYGMTIGEYAFMINQEGWLLKGVQADLEIIKCRHYNRETRYSLPIPPSPNLPNQRSILLYPSICLFEGTYVSEGRGTTKQFQVYGHPDMDKSNFSFTPVSMDGAKSPAHMNKLCGGVDLSQINIDSLYQDPLISLSYVLHAHQVLSSKGKEFFLSNNFFEKLAGTDALRKQIKDGLSEEEIRASWLNGLEKFKSIRSKYLLYN